MKFLARLDDASRALIMTMITTGIALGTSFGLTWTAEQVGAITAFAVAVLNVLAFLTRPNPPKPPPAVDPPG